MNLKDYGIAVGNPADIVVFDATTPEEAIAEVQGAAGRVQERRPDRDAAARGAASAMKLSDIAQVIRSKNAGPRRLTLDIMFGSDADYQRVVQSPALGAEAIGRLYRVPADAGDRHSLSGRARDQDRDGPQHHGRRSGGLRRLRRATTCTVAGDRDMSASGRVIAEFRRNVRRPIRLLGRVRSTRLRHSGRRFQCRHRRAAPT